MLDVSWYAHKIIGRAGFSKPNFMILMLSLTRRLQFEV